MTNSCMVRRVTLANVKGTSPIEILRVLVHIKRTLFGTADREGAVPEYDESNWIYPVILINNHQRIFL